MANDDLVFLHSPVDLLRKFVALFQERFSTGQTPWTWTSDENDTDIFILSEFSIPRDVEDASPAVVVTRSSVVHNRDVIADHDQTSLELIAKKGEYHWGTVECDIRIECFGQTRGESSTIGDIVATTIHMTRNAICKAFAFRDLSPVVQQPTVEYERDQRKWLSVVEFRVYLEERWFTIPGDPVAVAIDIDISGQTAELTQEPAQLTQEELQIILDDNPVTAPTELTLTPDKTLGVNNLVFLHSPINLLNQFVALFRTRFVTGQLPWTYREDDNQTGIFVESEFSIPRDKEDLSPAVIISRGSVVHKRDVISDTDQNNLELVAKSGEYEWSTGECDIRIQVIGQTKAEASVLGDIVQTTVHMTRDAICRAYTLRDISPVVQSPVREYERDQQKWICTVDFRVFFEHRWFSIPDAPVLREIVLTGFPFLSLPDTTPDSGGTTGGGGTSIQQFVDKLVRVSDTDTVSGFLFDKLIFGDNITGTIVSTNGQEQIQLDATGGGGGGSDTPVDAAKRDLTNPDIVYIGRSSAAEGSKDTSIAEWQIYRYDSTLLIPVHEYADGNANFDNIWDNRASLSYSALP